MTKIGVDVTAARHKYNIFCTILGWIENILMRIKRYPPKLFTILVGTFTNAKTNLFTKQ